jgi:hypothetical protein
VIFKDGDITWSDGLPDGLYRRLQTRPVYVSLGPKGEWFVKIAEGGWKAEMSEDAWEEVNEVVEEHGRKSIRRIVFGADKAYVLAYRKSS